MTAALVNPDDWRGVAGILLRRIAGFQATEGAIPRNAPAPLMTTDVEVGGP